MVNKAKLEIAWKRLNMLKNPVEWNIIKLLSDEKVRSVSDIWINLRQDQGVVSLALTTLYNEGYLLFDQKGKFHYYSISHKLANHIDLINEVAAFHDDKALSKNYMANLKRFNESYENSFKHGKPIISRERS